MANNEAGRHRMSIIAVWHKLPKAYVLVKMIHLKDHIASSHWIICNCIVDMSGLIAVECESGTAHV